MSEQRDGAHHDHHEAEQRRRQLVGAFALALREETGETGTKAALTAASATSWRMRLGMTATEANVLSWTLTPKALAVRISRATPTIREMPVAPGHDHGRPGEPLLSLSHWS